MQHVKRSAISVGRRWTATFQSQTSLRALVHHDRNPSKCLYDVALAGSSSTAIATSTQRALMAASRTTDILRVDGLPILSRGWRSKGGAVNLSQLELTQKYGATMNPFFPRSFASTASKEPGKRQPKDRKEISTVEDPFDSPTYNIPEKPVTFTEGASYSIVILAGLGIAAAAGYAVFKELIFQPKEYKIFDKALKRIQDDGQVRVRIGSPITGYGQESRNRAARQRIANRVWTDEDGTEHVEVNFYIRGPHGAGKVYAEMFQDKVEKQWKFTYLIVDIKSPSAAQLMLESYMPA